MRILLVDDDKTLIEVLSNSLKQKNYAIDVVTDGEQGWIYGTTYSYDLIILDWSLPKLDGISLCKRFRAHGDNTPIILLTARDGSQNKIKGLDAGADDYICKPFDIEELSARIRALLRRLNCDFLPVLTWEKLRLDPSNCQVTYAETTLSLAAKEYRLLELFLRHKGEVLTLEDIIHSLWSSTEYPAEATVRSHIRRLRQKLKQAGLPKDVISTIRGQGYCLNSSIHDEENLSVPSQSLIPVESPPKKQAQHLAALTSAWEKYRPKSSRQLATIQQAIEFLRTGKLTVSDRVSAIVAAHSLAGNLGMFGFDLGSNLARKIEQLLQNSEIKNDQLWLELGNNLGDLRSQINNTKNITDRISNKTIKNLALLLIVDQDRQLLQELSQEALEINISSKTISTPQMAKDWLKKRQLNNQNLPDVVLIKISFTDDTSKQEYLELIAEFKILTPSIPVIVIADRDRFQDRLQIARHGASFFLTEPINSSQIVNYCQQAIQRSSLGKKIMVVDDDVELLEILPSLLQPWGFELTTLDDSRQFWDVLQAVTPDLLILDIEMPYLSGIEICKVMRTHPYWCKLPVLFLSVHTDIDIFAFTLANGTNDFVNKPVTPQQLAHRILNLL